MSNLNKIFVCYIFLFFVLTGCSNIVSKQSPITNSEVIKKTVYIDVNLDGTNLEEESNVKQLLLSKGEQKGILEIAKDWLNKRFMFQILGETKEKNPKEIRLNLLDNNFTPVFDNMTNIYQTRFKFTAELNPLPTRVAVITGIEGGYSLATSHVAIELLGDKPIGNTFFVVAKKNDFNAGSYYQMIGIGKIYHVIGKIAQAEILTSTQEIKQDDMIVLLKTKISPIVKKKIIKQEKKSPSVVKVYPIIEKKEQGPKEMK